MQKEELSNSLIPSIDSLFLDLEHPNPNINYIAVQKMNRYWPKESENRLISNLQSVDVNLRRKSVKAISSFGPRVINKILDLYLSKPEKIIKVSCLKVLVKLAANNNLEDHFQAINQVINLALEEDSVEIVLTVISLLRQLGGAYVPKLLMLTVDKNILKSNASITALEELKDPFSTSQLMNSSCDESLEKTVRENAIKILGNN